MAYKGMRCDPSPDVGILRYRITYLPDMTSPIKLRPQEVAPKLPPYKEVPEYLWRRQSYLNGCTISIAWLVVCVAGYIILFQFDRPKFPYEWRTLLKFIFYISPCVVASLVVVWAAALFNDYEEKNETLLKNTAIESSRRQAREQSEREARWLSERIRNILHEAATKKQSFSSLIDEAHCNIRLADDEFERKAYSPFWDRIESAVDSINKAMRTADELSKSAADYYRLLQGEQHTFSEFPIRVDELAWSRDVLPELQGIIRKGQTNFEFALIWEQRRTREVLIEGFKTLDEATRRIGGVMIETMGRFERSISDDLARKVINEIKRMRRSE